jgi:hypothetical protein
MTRNMIAANAPAGEPDPSEHLRQHLAGECAKYYEALLGSGLTDSAAQIAERLINFDNSGHIYAALINGAVRAEAVETARTLVRRGLRSLPDAEQTAVREASAKIPTSD